jgi:hypothetical protein
MEEESDEETEEEEENPESHSTDRTPMLSPNPKAQSAEKQDALHSAMMSAKLGISDFTRQMEEVIVGCVTEIDSFLRLSTPVWLSLRPSLSSQQKNMCLKHLSLGIHRRYSHKVAFLEDNLVAERI